MSEEFFVEYRVGRTIADDSGTLRAGPYLTWEEAVRHARDIEGYEGVRDVCVRRVREQVFERP